MQIIIQSFYYIIHNQGIYSVWVLRCSGYLNGKLISTERLQDEIIIDGVFISKEAEAIDNMIFFYVPDIFISATNKFLVKYVRDNIK